MFHEPYPKPLKHYHNILLNNQMLTAVFHLPTYIPQNQADTLTDEKRAAALRMILRKATAPFMIIHI